MKLVPTWVRWLSVFTVVLATLLLALGGFVTSFRVGMADPVWPTEPWFLFSNTKWDFGFVVEHTHRLAGWIVGAATSVLALAVWWTEPDKRLKWFGFGIMIALLLAYGEFHRGMGGAWNEIKELARTTYNLDPKSPAFESTITDSRLVEKVKSWPTLSGMATLTLAIGVIACGVLAGLSGATGGWLRAMALIALVAIMLQGLLGGFRVFFNALAGSNLAAIHGAFGQISFCTLVAVMVLTAPRRAGDAVPDADRESFTRLAGFLFGLLALQLIVAVMLRHGGSSLSQRLHMLLAFAIAGVIVWLVGRIASNADVNERHGVMAWHLVAILAVQVTLGVESYIGKFAATGPQAQVLPELRPVKGSQAAMRTAHQLVGCGLLASSLALAIRISRRPLAVSYHEATAEHPIPPVAAMALNVPADKAAAGKVPDVASYAIRPADDGLVR